MANDSKPSYFGKVTIGSNKVLGMGTWTWSGFTRDTVEDIEFGIGVATYEMDVLRPGTISFDGNYKKDDTQGQDILRSYHINEVEITDIRFYVDSVSYYTPNSTTGAGGGLLAGEKVASAIITSVDPVAFSQGSIGKIGFSVQLTGHMRLI